MHNCIYIYSAYTIGEMFVNDCMHVVSYVFKVVPQDKQHSGHTAHNEELAVALLFEM